MIQLDYPEKVYAGLYGKCIGVRLGAPVEPTVWSYERIRDTYGDIRGYVKDYKNFAADDDVNGPIFFIRALYDYGEERRSLPRISETAGSTIPGRARGLLGGEG